MISLCLAPEYRRPGKRFAHLAIHLRSVPYTQAVMIGGLSVDGAAEEGSDTPLRQHFLREDRPQASVAPTACGVRLRHGHPDIPAARQSAQSPITGRRLIAAMQHFRKLV